MIKVTLVKSYIGFPKRTRETVHALGLNKIGSCAVHNESDAILGMIRKTAHLVKVEQLQEATEAK